MTSAKDRSNRMKALFANIDPKALREDSVPGEDRPPDPSDPPVPEVGRAEAGKTEFGITGSEKTGAEPRQTSGAVRSIQTAITQVEAENQELRHKLAEARPIVALAADVLDPSFVRDRLDQERGPRFQSLVESIEADGQQIPILVRPHPGEPGRYQIAYGHRRWRACQVLGRPVRAIVEDLDDQALVIAQGKENSERADLSFIEQALFAVRLKDRGFDRQTIAKSLGRPKAKGLAYISILTTLGASLPVELVQKIGSAPKSGRPKWERLAAHCKAGKLPARKASALNGLAASTKFGAATSDRRLAMVLALLDEPAAGEVPETPLAFETKSLTRGASGAAHVVHFASGDPAMTLQIAADQMVISIDQAAKAESAAAPFARWLSGRLPHLLAEYEAGDAPNAPQNTSDREASDQDISDHETSDRDTLDRRGDTS